MACIWFWTLDARHLLRPDEGRYAEIAREMFASGDWVTVRYNGLKYFEKPPFHLWMTALAYHAFGVGEWQARLWVGLSGAIGLLMTMLAARRWFGARAGWLAGLVLLATPAWNLGSHFNSLDMGVSGALACMLAAVLLAQHPQATVQARRRWMWLAWVVMGVAVLTKGLIGVVLPGLVLVLYTLLARDWALWRRLYLVSGGLWMLLITVPWFVLVSQRNPEFAQFFFIHEHWERYTSSVHQRGAPVWYFVPQLLVGFFPWLGLLPRMVGVVQPSEPGFRPALLLWVWVAVIFAFFSLSSSKLPGYILPVYPALAILAALALDKLDARVWSRQVLCILALTLVGLAASPLVGRMASEGTPNALYRAYAWWVAVACLLATVGLGMAWYLNRKGQLWRSMGAFSLALFAATTVALVGHETLGRSASGVALVGPVQAILTPDMPIYSVRMLDHTLPFYLRRTMIMVESPNLETHNELAFGTEQEPDKWLPSIAAFVQAWSAGRPALAIMSSQTYSLLRSQQLPMTLIAQDARRVVVANFSKASP